MIIKEDEILLSSNETREVILQSRGAIGLQLLHECSDETIVQIRRIDTTENTSESNIGGGLTVVYEIKAIKRGQAQIQFYETQPWNKSFGKIVVKSMVVHVK